MKAVSDFTLRALWMAVGLLAGVPVAAGAMADDVEVRIQAGHVIRKFTVSNNERYVFTTDDNSVAMWDLRKRKIVNTKTMNVHSIYPHPVNPTYVCVQMPGEMGYDYYHVFDMASLKEMDPIDKSRVGDPKKATTDLYFKLNDGVLDIYLADNDGYIGSLDSSPLPLAGSLDISSDGRDKILVSGMEPVIWEPGRMTATAPIDYFGYLKDVAARGNVQLTTLYEPPVDASADPAGTYGWGWKQTTSGNFEPDGTVRICGYDGDISFWNPDGSRARTLQAADDSGPIFSLQRDGDRYVAATYNGVYTAKGSLKLRPASKFNEHLGRLNVIYDVTPPFSGGKFLAASDNSAVLMGDLDDPACFRKIYKAPYAVMGVKLHPDRKHALAFGEVELVCEIDLDRGSSVSYKAPLGNHRINAAVYLPGDIIGAGTSHGRLAFWKRGDGAAIKTSDLHSGSEVIDIMPHPDGSKFYTLDKRGTVAVWDAATLSPVMFMHSLGHGDYLYITPDHYYSGSRSIYDKIHFTRGRDVYSFEQFDLLYNRPDIVYERLGGSGDRARLLRKAWERRVRRMGMNPADIAAGTHVPTVRITNAASFPHVTADTAITLNIRAKDTMHKLSRLMVSVNGVPVGSRLGDDIAQLGVSEYVAKKPVSLASGRNHIEVSCMNDKGAESFKTELNIWCRKPERKPVLYLAAVGVSQYRDGAYNLGYAAKDAADFAEMIRRNCAGRFSDIKVCAITDTDATQDRLRGLRDFYSDAGVDDVAMLFYAGHGVLDSDLDYYLATHDMDFRDPARTGWRFDDFEDLLDGIRPLAKYCFIDACHSGKIDKEEFIEDNTKLVAAGSVKFRGNGGSMTISEEAGEVNSAIQSLFTDFSKGNGATVLSSSGGMEVAIEDNAIANGLFTYAIKQGVEQRKADSNRDGEIMMSELADYVNRCVRELSGGVQTPGMRLENKYMDIKLFK